MPIEAAVINAADAAEMSVPTGGAGTTVSLVEISGKPKFRDKWSTGVHPVPYAIRATSGMREWGIGNYNADSDQLERPDVVLSWAPGVGYGSTRVSLPTSGVTVGFAVTVGMYNQIQADLQSLEDDVTAFVADLAGKADAGHVHTIAQVTGLQAVLDVLAGGEGGGVTEGDRVDIVVEDDGNTWRIKDGAVDTAALGGDVTTAGKALLTAADVAAQRTALALGTAALSAATAFAAAAHQHAATDLTSGTVPSARMPALTGDVTMAAGTTTTAIPLASIASSKLGVDITTAGKTLITANDGAAQRAALSLGSAATASSSAFAGASHAHGAGDITSGTLAAARLPALTGDVTMPAGTTTTTIPDGSLATVKLGGDVTAFSKGLLTAADADAARTTHLGLTESIGGTLEGEVLTWDGTGPVMERAQTSVSFRMATPVNGTEPISEYIGFKGVPIGVSTRLEAGTASLTVSIDGVAIPGLSGVPVTTTRTLTLATADLPAWTAASYMTFTLASVTGASKFSASFVYKRVR